MKTQTLVVYGVVALLLLTFVLLGVQQKAFPGVMDLPARVQQDLANEKKRFLPENSIDIAMAMKLVTHGEPSIMNPTGPQQPLLLYPPSEDTLMRLSGQ